MNSILIANKSPQESEKLKNIMSSEYSVTCISSPDESPEEIGQFDLILLDHNFTESSGIDFLMQIMKTVYLPILIITPITDPQCAVEALRSGAYNYIVETEGYELIVNIAVREALIRFNEREEMRQTILQLRNKVEKLESGKGVKEKSTKPKPKQVTSQNNSLVKEIISRFKRGDINLPPVPGIINEFNEKIKSGASIADVAGILEKDIGICTKLINVSNSTFYKGVSENKNLEDAISRLGLSETRQYVYAISNRNLYSSKNKTYGTNLEKLWLHSLACAYATQLIAETLDLQLKEDAFTLGLLHDIGILILLEIVGEFSVKEKDFIKRSSSSLFATIQQLHGKFGAVLLKRWKFSPRFSDIALNHHSLNNAKALSRELIIVHLADSIAKAAGYWVGVEEKIDVLNTDSAKLLKIKPDQIEVVMKKMDAQVGAFNALL